MTPGRIMIDGNLVFRSDNAMRCGSGIPRSPRGSGGETERTKNEYRGGVGRVWGVGRQTKRWWGYPALYRKKVV